MAFWIALVGRDNYPDFLLKTLLSKIDRTTTILSKRERCPRGTVEKLPEHFLVPPIGLQARLTGSS